jgi:hypothetical protein
MQFAVRGCVVSPAAGKIILSNIMLNGMETVHESNLESSCSSRGNEKLICSADSNFRLLSGMVLPHHCGGPCTSTYTPLCARKTSTTRISRTLMPGNE